MIAIFMGHSFRYLETGIWKLEGLVSDLKKQEGKASTLWLTPSVPTLILVALEANQLRVKLSII